ncbi:S49 family peptidase [Candidatus Mesenet endosymbiont of Agriotes lineatus]|uniref:S49 family peptidase n=1 Tax=Candidatus Mesenet endosymbiont of Agriotes lineatus TaxID=3077948 RepID=UPI0030CA7EA9
MESSLLLSKPLMLEPRSFELLSLHSKKLPIFKNLKHIASKQEGIAIIPIYGILTQKPGAFDDVLGMTSYERIYEQVEEALADSSIETILLDIDSPGGEVNGVFDLADFIYNTRSKKEIIATVSGDAYSAAYAIASSAEKILLTRTSGVGSIGVIASHIDQSSFDEKQGIKYSTVFAGNRKNDLNPHEPITSESKESLQGEVNRLYEMFVELIARNRDLSTTAVRSTEAGLYFGESAIDIGLADEITTFADLKEKIFINKQRSFIMNKQITNQEEQNSKDIVSHDKQNYDNSYRTEVLELVRLCNLSRMPEKLGEFIEQNISAVEAREILMTTLAQQATKTEILSTLQTNVQEDLVIQVAKSRQSA